MQKMKEQKNTWREINAKNTLVAGTAHNCYSLLILINYYTNVSTPKYVYG